jgi:hypothetical protein
MPTAPRTWLALADLVGLVGLTVLGGCRDATVARGPTRMRMNNLPGFGQRRRNHP